MSSDEACSDSDACSEATSPPFSPGPFKIRGRSLERLESSSEIAWRMDARISSTVAFCPGDFDIHNPSLRIKRIRLIRVTQATASSRDRVIDFSGPLPTVRRPQTAPLVAYLRIVVGRVVRL